MVVILDTTVLVYAVGQEHPLREPCRRLLATHGSGHIEVTTTVEVIQEFAHVRARRRTREDAATLARQYALAFPLVMTQPDDLELGLTIFTSHPALGAFDAVLAAVALNRRAEALVSADSAFAQVAHLNWIDPATPALDQLIKNYRPGGRLETAAYRRRETLLPVASPTPARGALRGARRSW